MWQVGVYSTVPVFMLQPQPRLPTTDLPTYHKTAADTDEIGDLFMCLIQVCVFLSCVVMADKL
jgi:hypothetical protein